MAAAVDLSKVLFSSPFYGDDRDADNGFIFARELQKAGIIYDATAHAKIVKIWALSLEGEAKAWWKEPANWTGKDKTDIDVVVDAFEKMWPAPNAAPKKQHEKMAEFDAVTLADEEVGKKYIDHQGAESTRHVWFIKELMKKAYAAGDSNAKNLMLRQAISRLPPRLAKAIGDTCVDIQTWDELLLKTEAISRAKIEQVTAEEKRRKDMEDRLLKIEGKSPEPSPAANTPAPTQNRDSFTYQRPYQPPASPATRPFPRIQAVRLATPPPATPLDPLADVPPLTNKNIKLTHENTVDGWRDYQQAQRDWDEKWGANMLPTAARPYPLQPGGADIGGADCWKCGHDGHFGRDCRAPESHRVPPKEEYWRQVSQSQGRMPAPPRTPVTLRSRAFPNSPVSRFATPPAAPGTPSPSFPFRRAAPPHTPQNNVLMIVDGHRGYYGDIDASQMFDMGGEWDESAPDYHHYQGNGSGSNGN